MKRCIQYASNPRLNFPEAWREGSLDSGREPPGRTDGTVEPSHVIIRHHITSAFCRIRCFLEGIRDNILKLLDINIESRRVSGQGMAQ